MTDPRDAARRALLAAEARGDHRAITRAQAVLDGWAPLEKEPEMDLEQLLEEGRATYARELERKRAAEAAEAEARRQEWEGAWGELRDAVLAALPEVLHPYVSVGVEGRLPYGQETLWIEAPGLAPIKAEFQRDAFGGGGWKLIRYDVTSYELDDPGYEAAILGGYDARVLPAWRASERTDNLTLALAVAERWQRHRDEMEAEAARRNAEYKTARHNAGPRRDGGSDSAAGS